MPILPNVWQWSTLALLTALSSVLNPWLLESKTWFALESRRVAQGAGVGWGRGFLEPRNA